MTELERSVIDLLTNKTFLREYIVASAVCSARRSVIRKFTRRHTTARGVGISYNTQELEQLRMYLDRHLKLDEGLHQKVTHNTCVDEVPYKDFSSNVNVGKALYNASKYLESLATLWYTTTNPQFTEISSKFLKTRIELKYTLPAKVSLEDLDDYEKETPMALAPQSALMSNMTVADPCITGVSNGYNSLVGSSSNSASCNANICGTNITQKEEPKMCNIKVEKQTLLNGHKIETFSDDAIYNMILAAEGKVKELELIQNKPKRLVKEIESRKADIQTLVDYLDAKDA